MEYRIAQQLIHRRAQLKAPRLPRFAEQLISTVAASAALVLLGSYMQELLWVLLAASTVLVIGTK